MQSILNTESAYCTQLQTLNTQLTALQNQVNNLALTKPVTVTACDPNRVTVTETPSLKTFKVNGLVPPKTILPYFGLPTDFGPTGLGIAGTQTAGWAIANGNNGTVKVIDTTNLIFPFIKYGPTASTTSSGNNTVTLSAQNIPPVSFTTNANFTVTGTTNEAGKHGHKSYLIQDQFVVNTECPVGDNPVAYGQTLGNELMERGTDRCDSGCDAPSGNIGCSGLHSHTFTGSGTGSFTGSTINNNVQSINTQPVHIQAIPIQFVGC